VKFEIVQDYRLTPAEVLAAYADPALYAAFDGIGIIGDPDVLEHEATDDRVRLAVRYRFQGDIPAAALTIVRPDRLTWVEHTTYDLGKLTAHTRIAPDHYPDRLSCVATNRYEARDDGCRRIVTGDLRVRALLVGPQVERAIVSGMRDHLRDEAEVVNQWTT
jgi:hypothetical protein